MMTHISLDGAWQFQIDPNAGDDAAAIESWRTAIVPMPWQAQFDDLRHYSGVAWARRTVSLDAAPEGAAILHFGAVDYHATVWVNGSLAMEHEGGYLPFEADVAGHLHAGANEILVRMVDPSDDRKLFGAFPFSEIPHGKQSWYGPIGGIWQSVWLDLRPALHIRAVRLTPTPASATIDVVVTLSAALPKSGVLQARVLDPNGKEVAFATLDGGESTQIQLATSLALWSPDAPNLYTVETMLVVSGATQHATRNTCGFRTVESRDGRIYLNGQPIYLRGVLDQAYYPETIYTPPSVAFLEDQALKAKGLGLNCLRTHIKIEDPRYYEVADRLGLLIWTEIPNWVLLTAETDQRARATFRAMVERDWNHPSIIIWTLINENWGTDLSRNPTHRRWLTDFYHWAKTIDPTRLIVDNSACGGNSHVAGDLEDYHHYRAIPDHAKEWDEWVAEFASRASDWVWYEDYQHERRADLPLLVSEFGNWGLPDPETLKEHGRDPWWFETGHEWGEGIVYPHAMAERFSSGHMAEVFGSFEAFVTAAQVHMARSLHYEISSMRLHQAIAGYIITEFTDVHWECNGLLTMQRQVKHGLDPIFTSINQDRVVVARPQRWSGRPGDTIAVELAACDIDGVGATGVIEWSAGAASGAIAAPGGVVHAPLAEPGVVPLQVRWLADDGALLASNAVELICVAPTVSGRTLCVIGDSGLAATLGNLGYTVMDDAADAAAQGAILVARSYTKEIEAAVQNGAHVILVAGPDFGQSAESVRLPAGYVSPRAGTAWQGDWATSFSWLKKQGPFATLPGSPLLEMEFAEIAPDAVYCGVPAWAARTHSWAGLALGWIHKPVSLLAEMPYGLGHVTLTTFKLDATTLAHNTVAQALWDGIVQLA